MRPARSSPLSRLLLLLLPFIGATAEILWSAGPSWAAPSPAWVTKAGIPGPCRPRPARPVPVADANGDGKSERLVRCLSPNISDDAQGHHISARSRRAGKTDSAVEVWGFDDGRYCH